MFHSVALLQEQWFTSWPACSVWQFPYTTLTISESHISGLPGVGISVTPFTNMNKQNDMPSNVLDEIAYSFLNINGVTIEV